jgi:hypothetical protein
MNHPEKDLWQTRYEQLRRQILEPSATLAQDRWGLSLLLRKGLAGWMRLWQDPAAIAQEAAPASPLGASSPAPGWQQQAALLLANMALGHFHPATPQPV